MAYTAIERNFLVYMHVNKLNGKVYVGITHHENPIKRWGYSGDKYMHSTKFIHAIHKYGWDSFDHIILCRTTKERAIVLEKTLIAHYKRINMSYNLADGGEGTDKITELNRQRISQRMKENHPFKGKHHTAEARAKISEAGHNRVMKESTRQKLADKVWNKMGHIHNFITPEGRAKAAEQMSMIVLQFDKKGNFIREFSSTIEADMFVNNGKRQNHIADVCNGKRKTAHGYVWKYKEERRSA